VVLVRGRIDCDHDRGIAAEQLRCLTQHGERLEADRCRVRFEADPMRDDPFRW
jgi:hypothetical protein